ncbi:MAG: hypothetical protein PVJ72_07490 [Gammaproteobacteria bacterium]
MIRCIKSLSVVVLVLSSYAHAASVGKSENSDKGALKTGLQLDVTVGLGYDSNIYRAPSDAYINYADPCNINTEPNCVVGVNDKTYKHIEPSIQSGTLIPAELNLDFIKGISDQNYLVTSYKFDGELYTDSAYDNANNYAHKIRLGDEYVFDNVGRKTHSIYVGGLLEHKKRLYLDRDTGEEQTSSGGLDVSNRYTYDAIGVEAEYKNRISEIQYNIDLKFSERDYEDPVAVSQYDHTYFLLGGDVKYQIAKPTKLTLGYKYYTYDYDERPSRNEDGRLTTNRQPNPPREYEYNKFDITLRHRINNAWLTYLDYERKTRTDKYVGYDNYTKDLFKVRVHYEINKNNKIKLSYAYWERDYPNAFAFDNREVGIAKQYDGTDLNVSATTKLDKNKAIVVDFEYVDENTTDLRYDYDRYRAFVSFQWEY